MFILLLATIHTSSAGGGHGHGEKLSRGILIDEIAEHIHATTKNVGGHTLFLYKDIKELVEHLGFVDCSQTKQTTNCNLVSIVYYGL